MSQIRINNLTNKTGDTGPTIAGVSTVSTSAFMVMPSDDTAIRGFGSGRAVVVIGATPSVVTTMDYFDTASTGNAVDFGDARTARYQNGHGGMASGSRGVFQGGASPSINIIEYVTISSGGGAADFGDHHRGITNNNGMCEWNKRITGGWISSTCIF